MKMPIGTQEVVGGGYDQTTLFDHMKKDPVQVQHIIAWGEKLELNKSWFFRYNENCATLKKKSQNIE